MLHDTETLHKLYGELNLLKRADASTERLDARFLSAPTCREIDTLVMTDKTLDSIESAEAIERQSLLYYNLLNGARQQIMSGQTSNVLAGLDAIRVHLLDSEKAYSGHDELPSCSNSDAGISDVRQACDPLRPFKRWIDAEFNKHSWPIAATPSAAFSWVAEQYKSGPENMKQPLMFFADNATMVLMPYTVAGRVAQLKASEQAAAAVQARQDARIAKQEHDASLIGNFTSMGDRLQTAIENILGGLVVVFICPMFFFLPFVGPLLRLFLTVEKLVRGYGGAFWLVAQNLDQIRETYPRWQNFIANCGAKQFFGTADVETARYVSDSLGKFTAEFQTANRSSGQSYGQSSSANDGRGTSQQFTGRELMTADEIMRLPREQEIVLITGEAPWPLNRMNYLRDPEFAGKFDRNPYE